MPGVFLLAPGAVFDDPNQQSVHSNATITASGSQVFTGYGASEVSLFINVTAAPTGTTPTLQYTIQEVDPGDGTTVIGTTVSSTVINAIGIQRITLESAFGGSIKVSWTIGGTGSPTFTQVYATLVAKAASIKIVDATGTPIDASNPLRVNPTGTTVQPVSGTVTGNQGTPNSVGNSWPVEVTDGTNVLGTAAHPVRTDPTGTTTQPVNGTVTANIGTTNGLALDATLTGGTTKAIVRGGAKGTTTAADVTSQNVDANTQALHVYIAGGGASGGTSSNFGAAFPSQGTATGWYDGTNMQSGRVFDADTGAGTQYVVGVVLRKSASGGSVELGTSSDPMRTDPTGTTTQPVSGTVTVQQATASNLNAVVTQGPAATLSGYWTVRVTDGTNTMPTGDVVGRAIFYKLTDGTNTAAVTASSALKVDGSAVTQPVSGTVTSNQGTAAGAGAPWSVELSDGAAFYTGAKTGQFPSALVGGRLDTNVGAWLGSTAPTVGSKTSANSLPVVIASDQGAIPVTVSAGTDRTSTGSITSNQNVAVSTQASGTCGVQITGTWTGTLVFEATVDGGTTWNPVNAEVPTTGAEVTSATANGVWVIACAGYEQVRVRGNTVASGTATVFLNSSTATQVVILGDPLPTGTNTIGAVNQGNQGTHAQRWMVGISDGSGFISPATDRTTAAAPFSVELSDGAAFYTGAKTGQFPSALVGGRLDVNVGAWLGSTAPTVGQKTSANSVPIVIASDQSRLPISTEVQLDYDTGAGTQNLSLVGLALPASGGAVAGGTASNPIRTDPTGTTTQPVSGTVTANQGTAAALSGGWPVKVTDGTNTLPTMDVAARAAFIKLTDGTNTTAVKAASTAAAAADPSAVVALSPNSPLPAGSNVVGGVTQSGTWTVQQGTPPWQVVGPGASGAAVTGNPVIMGGSDGTNARYISVDSSGRQVMVGAAASGAAVAGNPVLMGGSDGTNARSIITDTNGRIVVVSPTAANFNATARILGNAGSVLDATLAAGTAPSNGLGVLSQYNTTLPAPTNGQTLSLQSDQAGNLLAFPGVQTKAGSAWNSATANNTLQFPTGTSTVGAPLGAAAVLVQLNQTTTLTGGAITFEGTYDGSNWVTIPTDQVVNPQTLVALTNPYTFVASTNQPFLIVLQGFQQIRARLSTVITGTGTVTPNWTVIQKLITGLTEGVTGTAPPAQTTQVGGSDGTNLRTFLTDSAGRLVVISDGAATSFPTVITSNAATVHSNATITTSGSTIITSNIWGVQQLNLIVNVKNAPTGTTPTITYTVQEVDAGDGTTVFGNTVSTATITAAGVYTATIATTSSNAVKVSWTVTGTTPSFTGVYATVISKVTPATQATSSSPATTVPGIASGTVVTTSTANTAVRASTYNEQTTNAQRSVSSANANDTSAGTGARQIQITYLDSTGAGPSTETVTLNGTTAVNTVSSTICYIESIVVTSVGSTGSNVGTLTLFVATAGGGGTLATVNATDNRTFWAHHYVASSKTCKVTGLSGNNTSASNGSVLTIRAKSPLTSATAPEAQVGDYVRVGGGTAQPVRQYGTPISVAGPARILIYEACEGTPSITTRAAFDFYDQ